MNDSTRQSHLEQFSPIFSRLTAQDVEQFYADYQRWSHYQEIAAVQQKLAALYEQLAENAAQLERMRPSAIALATLTRLQASGVEDIDLLDRMLARGEDWLDRTIQHLEYCEQQGVIRDDYEEWCRHALEDAFLWLDTLQSAAHDTAPAPLETASPSPTPNDQPSTNETTEEQLLQKLMSEDTEETTPRLAAAHPLTTDAGAQFIAPAAGPGGDTLHNQSSTTATPDTTPTDTITYPANDEDTVETQFTAPQPADYVREQFIAPAPEPAPDDNAETQFTAPQPGDNGETQFTAPEPQPGDNGETQFTTPETQPGNNVGAQFIAPVAGRGNVATHVQEPAGAKPQKQAETAPRRPHFLRRLLLALWR